MTDRISSNDLLEDLRRSVIPVEEHEVVEERRARMVSHIARAIRTTSEERARSRRRARVFGALAVAAAVALVVLGALRFSPASSASASAASVRGEGAGVVLSHDGASSVVADGTDQRLVSGDELSTLATTEAKLVLDSGAVVQLSSGTRLRLSHVGTRPESIHLALGRVFVRVPHLGPSGRFVVSTPDASVTVHGTAFTVEVSNGATRVTVTEGEVGVRSDSDSAVLHPGDSWTSTGKDAAVKKAAPSSAVATKKDEPAPKAESEVALSAKPKTPPSKPAAMPKSAAVSADSAADQPKDQTDLPEQNRLFSSAVAARKSGDDARAVAILDQLLSRYPNGLLAPEARVERFRCLARMGKKQEAAKEARRYLLEHGDGAARDEARTVAMPDGG